MDFYNIAAKGKKRLTFAGFRSYNAFVKAKASLRIISLEALSPFFILFLILERVKEYDRCTENFREHGV